MIRKVNSPSAAILCISTHGMILVQSRCLLGSNCCIKWDNNVQCLNGAEFNGIFMCKQDETEANVNIKI